MTLKLALGFNTFYNTPVNMFYFALPSILSAIAGIVAAFAGTRFLLSHQQSKNPAIKDLGLVFLFLAGHAFTLAGISIFFLDQPVILGWGYNLAIFFVYLTLMAGVGIPVFRAYPFFRNNLNYLRSGLLILGLIIFVIQGLYLELPETAGNMVTNWNDNIWTGLITGFISLIYALTWAYLFWKDSHLVKQGVLRVKMRILSADGVLLGLAALFSLTFLREFVFENLAVTLFIIAVLLTSLIPFLPKTTDSLEGSEGEKK